MTQTPNRNFGCFVLIPAHELIHFIDGDDCAYDEMGNLVQSSSLESYKEFKRLEKCLISQTGNCVSAQGHLLLQEMIANNGGMKIILMALTQLLKRKKEAVSDN